VNLHNTLDQSPNIDLQIAIIYFTTHYPPKFFTHNPRQSSNNFLQYPNDFFIILSLTNSYSFQIFHNYTYLRFKSNKTAYLAL